VGIRDEFGCGGQSDGAGAVVATNPPVVVGREPVRFGHGQNVSSPFSRRLLQEALGCGAPLKVDLKDVDH